MALKQSSKQTPYKNVVARAFVSVDKMNLDSLYLHVSNKDRTLSSIFKDAHDFEVTLPSPLWMYNSQWEIALEAMTYMGEFITQLPPQMLTISCDLLESSMINGSQFQVLRRLPHVGNTIDQQVHWQFDRLQYIMLLPSMVTSVRLRLLNEKHEPAVLSAGSWIYYTLHLRRKLHLL